MKIFAFCRGQRSSYTFHTLCPMRKHISIKWLVTLFSCICMGHNSYSAPAYPYRTKVMSADGKVVSIFMRGDENRKYAITEDGYTILNDSCGWWYATRSTDGAVKKSSFQLTSIGNESEALSLFKRDCEKGLVPNITNHHNNSSECVQRRASSVNPIIGERRSLVVLMQYKDVSFKKTNEEYRELFNELDYHKDDATGSVRDFYRFASLEQFDFIADVYGPYTSKYSMSYYGRNNSLGGNDANALELCREAMMCLPKNIDFSIYDNNNDGLIDNVHIIFAGYGEEAGASADAIWSHEYPHRINMTNEIGYSLAGYSCTPELRGNYGNKISHIGVICHELGHSLGAMDYYDTNYGTGGEYLGTGKWDIMAGGSWNDDGRTPPNFNPYVRSEIFGWNRQKTLVANQQFLMPAIEQCTPEQAVVYKLETNSDGDYFLLENRQQVYFDSALPGAGLMVYHIHPNIERYRRTNTINATHPQCLYPVCASYSDPTKKKYGNINSQECPFPGSENVRTFSTTSAPAAKAWDGSSAKTSISNIMMNVTDGSISFTTSEESIIEPEKPDSTNERNSIYSESFESNISEIFSVTSVVGKEKWQTYKKGKFITNADLIPNATDGATLFMLFSGKDKATSESEAVSPVLNVEAGNNYFLTFDIYCEAYNNSQTPEFIIYIEDQLGEYNIYTFAEETGKWNSIELPLVFADSMFIYKLYGKIQSGGIFIDNIHLYKEVITNISTQKNSLQPSGVYSVTDIRLTGLGKGINIIRRKDGRVIKSISTHRVGVQYH